MKITLKTIGISLVWSALLLAPRANAQVIANDPFNYTSGSSPSDTSDSGPGNWNPSTDGGSGFSFGWNGGRYSNGMDYYNVVLYGS